MTIVFTELARKASIGTAVAWTSPSFAVAAGAKVWAFAGGESTTAWSVTANTGGLTFGSVADCGPAGGPFPYRCGLIEATNSGGAIGSMTLTVGAPSAAGFDVAVIQVAHAGTLTEVQRAVDSGSAGEPNTIGTLGSAATNGNTTVFLTSMNEDAVDGQTFSLAGWSNVSINSWATQNCYYGVNVVARTDFTGTDVTVTDYAVTPTWLQGIILEYQETGLGPPPNLMFPRVTQSGLRLR